MLNTLPFNAQSAISFFLNVLTRSGSPPSTASNCGGSGGKVFDWSALDVRASSACSWGVAGTVGKPPAGHRAAGLVDMSGQHRSAWLIARNSSSRRVRKIPLAIDRHSCRSWLPTAGAYFVVSSLALALSPLPEPFDLPLLLPFSKCSFSRSLDLPLPLRPSGNPAKCRTLDSAFLGSW